MLGKEREHRIGHPELKHNSNARRCHFWGLPSLLSHPYPSRAKVPARLRGKRKGDRANCFRTGLPGTMTEEEDTEPQRRGLAASEGGKEGEKSRGARPGQASPGVGLPCTLRSRHPGGEQAEGRLLSSCTSHPGTEQGTEAAALRLFGDRERSA